MLHRPTRFPALRVGLPVLTFLSAMLPEARAEPGFVLVEAGVRRAPIVVAAEAPPATRRAADELAVYTFLQERLGVRWLWPGELGDAEAPAPAPAAQAPTAQAAGASVRTKPVEEAWHLAFSDDFQREELGADWRVLEGEWAVSGGELAGHGVLLLDKPFPAFHRLEFEAATDAGAVVLFGERRPAEVSDLSCFLQAPAAADPAGAGYLFQFGGQRNTLHRILRAGETFRSRENPQFRIEPARRHRIVAENDAGALRLTVDGQVLLEGVENAAFVGKGQEHAGLYLYTPARIFHVKLHVKSLDDDRI